MKVLCAAVALYLTAGQKSQGWKWCYSGNAEASRCKRDYRRRGSERVRARFFPGAHREHTPRHPECRWRMTKPAGSSSEQGGEGEVVGAGT